MRFIVTRLCGGKALMASSRDHIDLDLDHAAEVLKDEFVFKKEEDLMLIMEWKDMEVTIYPQGNVMFHPLDDKDLAVKYATYILEKVR